MKELRVDIKINDQPIEFTLENEKNLGDIIEGVKTWLGETGFQITSIEHDGNVINPDIVQKETWEQEPISNITSINVTVLSPVEQYGQNLHTIYQFITLLSRGLAAGNMALINQLKEELPQIIEHLDEYIGPGGNYGKALEQLVKSSGVLDGELKPQVQKLKEFCGSLMIILGSRMNELTNPFEELKLTARALKEVVPKLPDVSVLLQTGRDREAMGSIIEFAEISEKLIRLYRVLKDQGYTQFEDTTIDNQGFSDFYSDLNGIFLELEEAFNSRDSVLIGDLLEYEVAPRTEKLIEYIDAIENIKEG